MKPAAFPALFVLLLLAAACGDGDRTNCVIAKENLDRCETQFAREATLGTASTTTYQYLPLQIGDDCSGYDACLADCAKNVSCDAMRIVLLGQRDPNAAPSQEAGRFNYCLQTCIEAQHQRPASAGGAGS